MLGRKSSPSAACHWLSICVLLCSSNDNRFSSIQKPWSYPARHSVQCYNFPNHYPLVFCDESINFPFVASHNDDFWMNAAKWIGSVPLAIFKICRLISHTAHCWHLCRNPYTHDEVYQRCLQQNFISKGFNYPVPRKWYVIYRNVVARKCGKTLMYIHWISILDSRKQIQLWAVCSLLLLCQ